MERKDWLALATVVVVAAVLRFAFLSYGLPHTPYVDAFRFVDEAKSLSTATGNWTPDDYMYPGLLKLLLAAIYTVFDVESRTWLNLTARILASLWDIGTSACVFLLARKLAGAYAALVAGLCYALCVIAVSSARIETADTMLTFFLTATLLVMTRKKLRGYDFLLAGLLVGCAMGTKYTGIYGGLSVLFGAVFYLQQGERKLRTLGQVTLAAVVALVTFVATTPWLIELHEIYWMAIEIQVEVQQFGQLGHVQSSPVDYLFSPVLTWEQPWLASSLLFNLGPLVLALGLWGMCLAAAGRFAGRGRALCLYAALFVVMVSGTGRVKAIRYLLPIVPILAVFVGVAASRLLIGRAETRKQTARLALAAALLVLPAACSLPYVWSARREMTTAMAFDWAKQHLPPGSLVLLTPFYVENLKTLPIRVLRMKHASRVQYRLRKTIGVDTEETPIYRPELVGSMLRAGIQYVVLNSYFEANLYDTAENRRFFPKSVAAYAAFRKTLALVADPVFSVAGQSEARLGPDIVVYRLRQLNRQASRQGPEPTSTP